MKPLRVLVITTGLGTGGAEHMLCKLIEAADPDEITFMVLSLRNEGELGCRVRAAGVQLICLGLPTLAAASNFFRILRQIRTFNPDVVQGWMYHGCVFASFLSRFFLGRRPVVWGIRQTLYQIKNERFSTRFIIWLTAKLSGSVSRIIYNSKVSCLQHRAFGYSPLSDEVIPNGFDLSRYRLDAGRRALFRSAHGIEARETVIGLVARVHPMKDHKNFIGAASKVAARFPGARFVLAGLGSDGESIRALLEDAGILKRTICLGRFENTELLYPGLDLLVLSSAWGEAWPNVLGEAMACGVPCVSTDVGDAAEILGAEGRIVVPGDPVALAEACMEVIANQENSSLRAERLREGVQERFGIGEVLRRYLLDWEQVSLTTKSVE